MDWRTINATYVHPAWDLYNQGRKKEAFELLKSGFQTQHQDGYIALTLGKFFENEGDDENAKKYYEVAVWKLPMPKYNNQAKEGLDRIKNRSIPRKDHKTIIVHGDLNIGGKIEIKDSVLSRTRVMGTKAAKIYKNRFCPNCGTELNTNETHCPSCNTDSES